MALGHVVSDNFFIFAVKKLYKTCDPQGRTCFTKGYNLNKLGKVALSDAITL